MVSAVSAVAAVFIASIVISTTCQAADLKEGDCWKPPIDESSGFPNSTKPYHRSPCPAINALANCGYLNRDGKDITSAEIRLAVQTQFGHDNEVLDVLMTGIPEKLSLSYLTEWEHPISLSRLPNFMKVDSVIVDLDLVQDLLNRAINGFLSAESMGLTYKARREKYQHDPRFKLTPVQERQAFNQGAGAVLVLGSKMNSNTVSVDVIREFFVNETFPAGWKRANVIGLEESRKMTDAVQAAAQ